jgi:translocation and assembly module TamA
VLVAGNDSGIIFEAAMSWHLHNQNGDGISVHSGSPKSFPLLRSAPFSGSAGVFVLAFMAAAMAMAPPVHAKQPEKNQSPPDDQTNFSYALKYSVLLRGAPGSVERMFREVSDLELQKGDPPVSLGELDRRVESDMATLDTVLRAQGYYQAEVDYRMDRTQSPIQIQIEVVPGKPFEIKKAEVIFDGAPEVTPQLTIAAQIPAVIIGEPAHSQTVINTEEEIMRRLPQLGYPLAHLEERSVIVDHATLGMEISYHVTPGAQMKFGPLTVKGLAKVRAGYVQRLIPWREGARYDQALVDDFRSRLAATGLFASIRVGHGDGLPQDGKLPVVVTVREAPHHTYGAGLTYSSGEGIGAVLFWENRNLFGNQEKLRTTAQYSEILKSLSADFVKPNFLRYDQKLLANVTAAHDRPTAYNESALKSSIAIERQISKHWAASVGGSLEYSHIVDYTGDHKFRLLGMPLKLRYDGSNSLLNPTTGMRLSALVQPYVGSEQGVLKFVRSETLGSMYLPIDKDKRFVFAARFKLGTIFGEGRDRLPADKRFYAGGGNSVRGYGYQLVGPLTPDLKPLGGRSLFETGAEVRIKLSRTIGIVPFIEGGNVFDKPYPNFSDKLKWGAGLGFRYYTDFAPVRLDIGIPLNRRPTDSRYQIYISIGQAF